MDISSQVQILDEAACFSFCANALGKGMNPSHLPLTKYLGRLGSLTLVWLSVLEKENSELKPVLFHFKKWPCVTSYPWWRCWVNTYIQ